MRKIVIIRGPQGSGKSRLAAALGLEGHALSYDAVRQVVSGDSLANDGRMTISQQHNMLVRKLAHESLERRMGAGETVLFEATLPTAREVKAITDMADAHRYRVLVVDLFATPIAFSIAGNAARPERTRIPDAAIERCYAAAENQKIDDTLAVVDVDASNDRSLADAHRAVWAFLESDCSRHDLSSYDRIVHVGDLQGCIEPLTNPASPLAEGLRDDTFYVFTGDLCDRGPDNAGVIRWWLDNAAERDNVVLLHGNHESHIERQANGLPPVSREFSEETMPQLRDAGFGRESLKRVMASTVPILHYGWRGFEVLCSHGGFPRWPTSIALLPGDALTKGAGFYQTPIDDAWDAREAAKHECERRWQVHGHRNPNIRPIVAPGGTSINLEGQVEFGGHMRFSTLDASGWTHHQIRSTRYRTMVQARIIDEAHGRQINGDSAPIAKWAREGRGLTPIAQATFDGLRAHPMVRESKSETIPGVSAFNFSKEAFWGKVWDEMTTHARGLFLDTEDRTVVARAYVKFWNFSERPETSIKGLRETVKFPVQGFDKSNGFLGITGYSERTGELVIASKSLIEGDFAGYARDALRVKLGDAGLERLLRVNRDQHASCVFEIVDPVNDPHIIKETEVRVVLLDCIRRDETFEKMDYEDLVKLAAHLGCEVKRRLFHDIDSWKALEPIMNRVENDPNWLRDSPTEGVVFEDGLGLHWKCKAHFYASWKRARSAVERIALCRRKDAPFDRAKYEDVPSILAFVDWAQTLPDEALKLDIVALRELWFADPKAAEAMGPAPTTEKPQDHTGFLKGVDAVLAQIDAGRAKPESAARLLARAIEDPDRLSAFDSHPRSAEIREFASAVADA